MATRLTSTDHEALQVAVGAPVLASPPRPGSPRVLHLTVPDAAPPLAPDEEDGPELHAVAQELVRLARLVVDERVGIRVQLLTSVAEHAGHAPVGAGTSHTFAFRSVEGHTGCLTLWGEELDADSLPPQLGTIAKLAESYLALLGRARSQSRLISRLEHTVAHDPLTGAVTRILLQDRLHHAQAAASRDERDVGLIYLDIDDFKGFNDRYGHVAGDQLLVAVARRVMQAVRPADTVARLGGDEFLVVCEEVAEGSELSRVVERIERSVGRPYQLPGTNRTSYLPVVSVGATLLSPDEDVDGAVRRADAAMYATKRRRRAACRTRAPSAREQAPSASVVIDLG